MSRANQRRIYVYIPSHDLVHFHFNSHQKHTEKATHKQRARDGRDTHDSLCMHLYSDRTIKKPNIVQWIKTRQ